MTKKLQVFLCALSAFSILV